MTYVITEACIDLRDLTCTEVCPVDCIHPTPQERAFAEVRQLFIDPGECVECDACVEVCPVDAIFAEEDLPQQFLPYTAVNRAFYRRR